MLIIEFLSLGISYAVFNAITKKGYKVPTPIQRKVCIFDKKIIAIYCNNIYIYICSNYLIT